MPDSNTKSIRVRNTRTATSYAHPSDRNRQASSRQLPSDCCFQRSRRHARLRETGKMLRDKDMNIDYPETVSLIAPKFHLQGIEVEIVSGTTDRDFQLTSK